MTKWGDYLISHIWVSDEGEITDVLLHRDFRTRIGIGIKRSEAYVIALIMSGCDAYTIMWNYEQASYVLGMQVDVVVRNGCMYLRSLQDNSINDHLARLPTLDY